MNKVYYNNERIYDYEKIAQFKLTIIGDNNEVYLNSFDGNAMVYVYIEGVNCKFSFGTGNTVKNDIGINFWIAPAKMPNNSKIEIGNNNFFNGSGISIIAPLDKSLIIGDRNLFAGSITFWGRNDHIIYNAKNLKRINNDKDIIIGSNNWICQNVSFLPGAIIGNDCVIGYGSLINKGFNKNNVLITGVPAKIKKKCIKWSRSCNYENIDFNDCINIK